MGKNKDADKKIAGHFKAINEHLRKQDRYGPSDTSASKTVRNSTFQARDKIYHSCHLKKEETYWDRKFPKPKKPW